MMPDHSRRLLERAPQREHVTGRQLVKPKREDPFFGFRMPAVTADLSGLQFIYIVRSNGADGLIKIGVANNLENRVRSLAAGNPLGITVLASRRVERCVAFQVERRVHDHFADAAHGREWFKLEPEAVLPVIDLWTRRARAALKYYKRLYL